MGVSQPTPGFGATSQQNEVTFNWTEGFEAALLKRLLEYRTAQSGGTGVESRLAFERRMARDFLRSLETLMGAHAPTLAGDSDIEAGVARLRMAHDGAQEREQGRMRG